MIFVEKKNIAAFFLIFFSSFAIFAFSLNPLKSSENRAVFSFSPSIGSTYGVMNEYVFDTSTGKDIKLSELNWDVIPICFVGLGANVSYSIFDFSFYAMNYFGSASASMRDSDWQNFSDRNMKTNYSISENTINKAFAFGTDFKVLAIKNRFVDFKGMLSLEYTFFDFSARNGYGWYGDRSHTKLPMDVAWNDPKAMFYGVGKLSGIDYQRSHFFTWTGLELCFSPIRFVTLSASFSVSAFSLVSSLDTHYGKTSYYDRSLSFFSGIKQDYCVFLNFSSNVKVRFGLSFCDTSLSIGQDSHKINDGYKEYKYAHSGNSENLWSWSVAYMFKVN